MVVHMLQNPTFHYGYILYRGILWSFIFIVVSAAIIYGHRRHIRQVAVREERKVSFKDTGSDITGLLECLFCIGLIMIFVLIGLEIIPSEILIEQLTPSNISLLILLSAMLYAFIPAILVIATIWTVNLQGRLLQEALQAKPRAKRKPIPKIRCIGCDRLLPHNWQYCDSCGSATSDLEENPHP